MKLIIDTADSNKTQVKLVEGGTVYAKESPHSVMRAQIILPLISDLLRERGLTKDDIDEISVVPGPGSYTGLRVGFAVGNMLATLLHVPINGGEPPKFPVYSE